MSESISYDGYYLSYSGVSLPLKLVRPLEAAAIENRNTFFGVCLDGNGREILIHKVVYGEIELEHRYGYHDCGALQWAEILDDEGEIQRLNFDTEGKLC
ncbi:MAG: hypothetical protein CMK89_03545 [Pseudomonadales bacterium]|nr:hypothetical protein [Pseudomonadales bacterium]